MNRFFKSGWVGVMFMIACLSGISVLGIFEYRDQVRDKSLPLHAVQKGSFWHVREHGKWISSHPTRQEAVEYMDWVNAKRRDKQGAK